MMIVGTVILGMIATANSFTFAQQQNRPTPLTERLLKAYMDLPDAQRKAENKRFLEMYDGIRVADVRDGMDWFGYQHYGSVDREVRPLWRTYAYGIARTVRYLPYVGPSPLERGRAYDGWQGMFYNEIATYPWMDEIEEGDFIALDMSGVDVGLIDRKSVV